VRENEPTAPPRILQDEVVNQRIAEAFMEKADAQHRDGARAFSAPAPGRLEEGRRHLRRLVRLRLDAHLRAGRPQNFPQLNNIVRKIDGGRIP
jgi:isoleucyl-tRNA synthetase